MQVSNVRTQTKFIMTDKTQLKDGKEKRRLQRRYKKIRKENVKMFCTKKISIAFITGFCLVLTSVCGFNNSFIAKNVTSKAVAAENTIKIMPLGDSITDGMVVPGGYRIQLWKNITKDGASVDFVGSMSNGPAELGDKNHEGHSGWRIDQVDTNINSWMDKTKPSIVLLHIGTNDVAQNYNLSSAPDRLSKLIDKICAKLPEGGKLYVAKIVPLGMGNMNQRIVAFNDKIPGIIDDKVKKGKSVYMVDMYSALTTADLQDGVHPNRTGYNKMAEVWYKAIRGDLLKDK